MRRLKGFHPIGVPRWKEYLWEGRELILLVEQSRFGMPAGTRLTVTDADPVMVGSIVGMVRMAGRNADGVLREIRSSISICGEIWDLA